MNNDGKSGINYAGLRGLDRFLFGSPYDPPLDRKGFAKAALIVFFVRMPIAGLLLWLFNRATSCNPDLPTLIIFIIPTALVFCCPYFFVMYRRLVFLACPRPRLVTWAAVIFLLLSPCVLIVLFSDWQSLDVALSECGPPTSLDLLSTGLCIASYLSLFFIPDPR